MAMDTSEAIRLIERSQFEDARDVFRQVGGNWCSFLCLVDAAGMHLSGNKIVGTLKNSCDRVTDTTTETIRRKALRRGFYD